MCNYMTVMVKRSILDGILLNMMATEGTDDTALISVLLS